MRPPNKPRRVLRHPTCDAPKGALDLPGRVFLFSDPLPCCGVCGAAIDCEARVYQLPSVAWRKTATRGA